MAWLSWHCFRRTHTTLANELGMAFTDRMAMMGHERGAMMRTELLRFNGAVERAECIRHGRIWPGCWAHRPL